MDFLEKNPNSLTCEGAYRAVGKSHPDLSMRTQCKLLGVLRSTLDYRPVAESAENLRLKRLMDEMCLRDPCMGTLTSAR